MSQEKERRLRQLIGEIQMMEGSVNALQQRLQLLNAAVSELNMAQNSLKDLKDIDKGSPLLVPVGGGVFMNAELGEIKKVIVDLGADVSMEMNYDRAVEDVGERLSEMEDAQNSVREQLSQIIAQMQSHQQMAERLSRELQVGLEGAV
ncbi:prefoldin subunit alpha [Candidatus Bathyarchaeota archaeon]|jgi:prefoldin alpha subunit|nr:prefoldin subunit alpha [Candidatus Bathyarchaeota archaeon]